MSARITDSLSNLSVEVYWEIHDYFIISSVYISLMRSMIIWNYVTLSREPQTCTEQLDVFMALLVRQTSRSAAQILLFIPFSNQYSLFHFYRSHSRPSVCMCVCTRARSCVCVFHYALYDCFLFCLFINILFICMRIFARFML